MGKYFGTDGIRGVFGEKLTSELCYRIGYALSQYFGKGEVFIGRDTRISGEEIESALIKGLSDGGMTAKCLGIVPTPAVAYLTKKSEAKCGIMITASHNPPSHNGIKFFDENGMKLNEEQEGSIEYYIDNSNSTHNESESILKNSSNNHYALKQDYIDYVVKTTSVDLSGYEIFLDCGYGATGTVAGEIFERLGAKVNIENYSLRGEKINAGCGALFPEYVQRTMHNAQRITHNDCVNNLNNTSDHSCALCDMRYALKKIGFSFDGDGDRLSVVYEGKIIDGDSVLYNLSRVISLNENVVAGTVLANLALEKKLLSEGKRLIRTPVGDKYICDLLFKKNYSLGGEQSGHYIIHPEMSTGDGIFAAIFFLKSVIEYGEVVILDLVPQKQISLKADRGIMFEKDFILLIKKWEEKLKGIGRLIVRMSGTEDKIRVMVECENEKIVEEALDEFREAIINNEC
ncbi:MAG: hypothetical protein FWE22_05930 [Firmicutes bacterium]|nr:hypothetical protein [Bacillota bacterium]